METLIKELAQFGILGLFLGIVLYAYFQKDKEVGKVRDERIKDNQDWLERIVKISGEMNNTIQVFLSSMKER